MAFTIFNCPLIHLCKKMKHWKLDLICYWVTGAKFKRTWNLAPVLQIVQKITENYCPRLYLSGVQVWWLHEFWFKRYIQKCTLPHLLILIATDSVNHGMVKNTKTWISWEQNIIFLQNKKILNLCPRWHVQRSYHFVVEVTFKLHGTAWNHAFKPDRQKNLWCN